MAEILKYIGKRQWISIDEKDILPNDKILNKVKKKLTKNDKINLFFERTKERFIG